MTNRDKERFNHLLLVLAGVILIANLVALDVFFFLRPQKDLAPSFSTIIERAKEEEETEKTEAVKEIEELDYRLICQEEINKALATISGETKEVSKTIYQQVPVSQPSTIYIPLGGGVSTTQTSWSYVGGAEGYFNKADYPGAKKITFEVFLKIKHAAGQAEARLYNATKKVVISPSEVSSGTDSFLLKTSAPLSLFEGNNLYQVQLRSSTGYEAYMEGARLKVEY